MSLSHILIYRNAAGVGVLNYHHGGGLALVVGGAHSCVSIGVVVVAHGLAVQLLGAGNALGLALGV